MGSASRQVFINGRFLTQRTTGVQRYARETLLALDAVLAEEAPQMRSIFTVLAPEGADAPALRVIGFRRVGPLSGNAWEQLTLPRACGDQLLISFGPTGPLVKQRQLVTLHDAAVCRVPEAYSRAFRTWYRLLLPALLSRVQRVMAVSEFARSEAAEVWRVDPARVSVSGEGWQHIQRVTSDARVLDAHGLERGRYVLAVGSLSRHKNLDVIARAMQVMDGTGVSVVVAGAVNPRIFGIHAASGGSTLKLVGYVDDSQLRALYEHAGAFVFPSRYEGFGIPPLEAMALGCPVVCSDAAAIPEACGEAALYFEPDDFRTLARWLEKLLSEPEFRSARIAAGREHVRRHSWMRAAREHLRVVEEWQRGVEGAVPTELYVTSVGGRERQW